MTFEATWRAIIEFMQGHIAYAEPLVFALGFAEGIPGLSILVPSSAIFLAVGAAHSSAGGEFWNLWLSASLGCVVGDWVTYSLGRVLRSDVTRLRYFAVHPDAIAAGHAVFERWGPLAVLAGKFTGFARPFIPVVAGILTMPPHLFFLSSAVSSIAWAGVFLSPGYGLGFFMK
ncbi:MAG: DedA family protein [Hyphomicrobiaceae bacterium]